MAGDIDQIAIRSVPVFTVENAGKGTYEVFCSVFHVFNGGKWKGLKFKPAYVTRLSESFSEIYRSPQYMKAFASYKVTTKEVKKVLRKEKKKFKKLQNKSF